MTPEPNLLLFKQTSYSFKQIAFGFHSRKETRFLITVITSTIIMIIRRVQSSGKNSPELPRRASQHRGFVVRPSNPLTDLQTRISALLYQKQQYTH